MRPGLAQAIPQPTLANVPTPVALDNLLYGSPRLKPAARRRFVRAAKIRHVLRHYMATGGLMHAPPVSAPKS